MNEGLEPLPSKQFEVSLYFWALFVQDIFLDNINLLKIIDTFTLNLLSLHRLKEA